MKPTKSLCICLVCVCVHVVVHAINFSPAFDINNDPVQNAELPEISLNSTGTAIAVWLEEVGGVRNIFARTFDGIHWSATADNLGTNTSFNADFPQVALNSTGTAIAVWREEYGGVHNIFARTFDGTHWSMTATSLNNDTSRVANNPQIALNSTGTAIAVWQEDFGTNTHIFARTFDGTNWSTAVDLNYSTSQSAFLPRIALNSTGTAIAIWQERTGFNYNIFASTFDGTNWSTAVDLNASTSQSAFLPRIALNSTGTAIAIWQERTGFNYNIFASTFDGTNWSTAVDLNVSTSEHAYYQLIALNSTGTAIAVWAERNGSAMNIFARMFDGTQWSVTATNLNSDTSRPGFEPQVALNDNGTAIVAWAEYTGIEDSIIMRTFDGTHWSTAVNLNNNTSLDSFYPQIGLNDDGTAIIVWYENSSSSGSLFHIFARHTVLPYYFTQWPSACDGNKQYIAAATYNETLNKNCVDIYEFLPNNNGIDFKISITFESTTTINSFAVYNKSDTELYLAIVGKELLQIWKFDGTSTTLEKDLSQAGHTYHDAQWWVSESHDRYIAAIDDTHLTVFDLSHSTTYTIAASGNKLLWTTKDSYRGVAVVDASSVTPYQIDYSTNPITITAGTGCSAPTGFEFESISTCGDYIAVGLTSTGTEYAQIHILDLDSYNNTLAFSGTSTTLAGQIAIPSLARCCCCSTLCPLLAGSYDTNRNYTISVLAPDLSAMYASTLLGNNVNSVGWSCQDKSIYFTAAGHEAINGFLYTVKYTCSVDGNTIIEPVVLNK